MTGRKRSGPKAALFVGQIRGWAFARLHLDRESFYLMRPGEYFEALAMWSEDTGADRKHIGELVRGAAFNLWNLQVDKKHRFKDPAKWWPMPWDRKRKDDAEGERLNALSEEDRFAEARKFIKRANWNSDGQEGS